MGVEPTFGENRVTRLYAPVVGHGPKRPGGFEPPHPPWQGGRLPGYIMDASSGGWSRASDLHVFSVTLLPSELRRITPARNRTWTCSFGGSRALPCTTRAKAPGAGFEPTPAGSEPAVLPLDDPGKPSGSGRRGSRTLKAHRSSGFGPDAIAHWLALPFHTG